MIRAKLLKMMKMDITSEQGKGILRITLITSIAGIK